MKNARFLCVQPFLTRFCLKPAICLLSFSMGGSLSAATVNVNTTSQLVAAVNSGAAGNTVNVAAGTYLLTASLKPKANMVIKGAGIGVTILRADPSWNPGTTGLPGDPMVSSTIVRTAYMFDFSINQGISISGLTMDGMAQLHGATYGYDCDNLEMFNLHILNFLMSGLRSFSMTGASLHDCIFEDAGGAYPDDTGGGIYATSLETTNIYNNRFFRSAGSTRAYYGIKGRKVTNCHFYNNTILLSGFSIECPHENDADVEIDHNYLSGTISIPKEGGGTIPASGRSYRIHHNYFRSSYSLEWARRGAEVDHNLFNCSTTSDWGDLVGNFSPYSCAGPAYFHDNLIKNPGRSIYVGTENQAPYNNLSFYNNHVIANTTVTPRTEGLFGFPTTTTFSTITIKDNIIECIGQTRPLFRNTASYSSVIQNNTLTGVSDSGNYSNTSTGAIRGLTAPLFFTAGIDGEYTVDGWVVRQTGNVVLVQSSVSAYDTAQDGSGSLPTSATVSTGGKSVTITGNVWKKHPFSYSVGPNTVMEVSVNASDAGEFMGITLDTDNTATNARRGFRFGGSTVADPAHDTWSWRVNPTYVAGSGLARYVIPVGSYFTGSVSYIGFVGDDDANGSTNATFSNIWVYEGGSALALSQASVSAYDSAQDGSGSLPTSGTVSGDGKSITIAGNAWKKHAFSYTVSAATVMQVTINSTDTGELLGIALENDNTATNTPKRSFRLGGSTVNDTVHDSWSWKVTPLYIGGSGAVTYRIPLGAYFTGTVSYLGFIGDDDANGSTSATFSNIKVFEN